ncbi:unnamed protein product [Peronospora belbahrii]|uniref:Protein ZIP4 homolog n=1 Tax=Peronospora belbahrii TaxID=622444 RepID=A0AAU9KXW0_9STRA|nr:unnamed protein product [Peronospora belbahrii]
MQEEGAAIMLKEVEKATKLLSYATTTSSNEFSRVSLADVEALSQVIDELQRVVTSFSSQRVLEISESQLMSAGVELYNAPRSALRVLAQVEKSKKLGEDKSTSFPRYLLVLTRFIATKIMGLSLICPKDGDRNSVQFMEQCVDVLRSYGRVGMLMLESASAECGKCEEYLALANESLRSSMQLWSCIGLTHLTKFKHGLELEDTVDDLWDFCVDRVRVLQLLAESSTNSSEEFRDIVSSLHELKMLAPYKISYASSLLDLMTSVSNGYGKAARHELQISFAEEALRICDSLENDGDESFPELIASFKQHMLVTLLQSLCSTGDIERAEACYLLIPASREPKVLLLMTKLYVEKKQFDKASRLLLLLFEQDCLDDSILGARTYAQGLSFSDKGLDIYRALIDNYGDAEFAINLDIACSLAFDESKKYQAMSELKRIGCVLLENERDGEVVDAKHIQQVRQTIFDALQHALNSNQHEDCLKWADAGLATTSIPQDQATYLRIMSRSCLQLGRKSEALEWAEKAYATEPSKQSLFTVFQVTLETKPEVTEEELVRFIQQLQARDDFEIEDLLAMGKQASNLGSSRQDLMMHILDELCNILLQADDYPANISIAVVLQNAAQLAYSKFARQCESSDTSENSYGEKFVSYANALLQVSRPNSIDKKETVGPSSVFEWFFRMSFDIAKSTEDSRYFIIAANIAERSDELYCETSPLKHRCHQCLLAAVSSDIKKFETLDKSQLLELLEVIDRLRSIDVADTSVAGDVMRYLGKAEIAVKLRLFDANTKAIFDLCMTTQHSTLELMETGELVLYAAKFSEASEVRDSYLFLSRQIFNYGLQMLVQAPSIDSSKLCYLLRRLVTLAESKTKAYECFEQLLQFIYNMDVEMSEIDMEWFVAKAWNIGVLCHRGSDTEDALKFMKIAQDVMQRSESLVEKLGNGLNHQYQELLRMRASSTCDG